MPIKSTYLTSSGYVAGAAATSKKTYLYGFTIHANQAAPGTPAVGYAAFKDGSSGATLLRVDVPATGSYDLSVVWSPAHMVFNTSCYVALSNAKITGLWD